MKLQNSDDASHYASADLQLTNSPGCTVTSPETTTTWRPGATIAGTYEVIRRIGQGGMGVVYLLRDPRSGELVAAKTPKGEYATDTELREQFVREARIWTGLPPHPNIVMALDVVNADYVPCILMEYVDGDAAGKKLKMKPHGLPLSDVLPAMLQVSWAMAFANSSGHVHRDLKPSNILITSSGLAKVADFGLAAGVNSAMSVATSVIAGTPEFIAPEQWQGTTAVSNDLYSFGMTIYVLLSGRLPFESAVQDHAPNRRYSVECLRDWHCHADTIPLANVRSDCAGRLNDLVMKLLAKEPEGRPGSFDEVCEHLRGAHVWYLGIEAPFEKPRQVQLGLRERNRRAWAMLRLGGSAELRSDLDGALSLYREARQLMTSTRDDMGLAACHNLIGNIHYARGHCGRAAGEYSKGLDTQILTATTPAVAESHLGLGNVNYLLGDYSRALDHYSASLGAFSAVGSKTGVAKCYNNMGNAQDMLGRIDDAAASYRQSIQIWHDIGNLLEGANCHVNIGDLLQTAGQTPEAMEHYAESISVYRAVGHRYGLAACLYNMGILLAGEEHVQEALDCYQESLQLREEIGDNSGIADCCGKIGELRRQTGKEDSTAWLARAEDARRALRTRRRQRVRLANAPVD